MELTPVRIPLKRRRRKGEPLPDLPPFAHKAGKASRDEPAQKRRRKKQKPGTAISTLRASYFEKEVPLEVLERIFWLSENINLPLASLRFGRLLSGRPTLRETFISAFSPTWEVWHGCVRGSQRSRHRTYSYAGWEDDSVHFGGNPALQSALLRQPWADISMILESEQSWHNRFARDRFHKPAKLWGKVDSADMPAALKELLNCDDNKTSSNENSVKQEFLNDYLAFREVENSKSQLAKARAKGIATATGTYINVHRDTQIPDDLLAGPWEENALQKFFWLVRAGARLTEDQTWETTLEGFRNATGGYGNGVNSSPTHSSTMNLTVVRLLGMLDAFKEWPQHILQEQLDRVVTRLEQHEKHAKSHEEDEAETCTGCYQYSYIASQIELFLRGGSTTQ